MASAPSNNNLLLWEQLDADTTHENSDVLRECDVIFLAVKPNMFETVMADLEKKVTADNAKASSQKDSPSEDDASAEKTG